MRRMCLCLVPVLALTVSGALMGGETNEAVLKKIQGTWKFVAQGYDGKERPKDELKGLTVTFTGDKWSVRQDDKVVQAGTHKFDPSKTPIQVDAPVTEGEGKGTTMLGIIEVKGDTIKVCFDPQGKTRPTTFDAKDGRFAATVQRLKKKS